MRADRGRTPKGTRMNTSTAQIGNAVTNGSTQKSASTATESTKPTSNEPTNRSGTSQLDFADLLAELSDPAHNSILNKQDIAPVQAQADVEITASASALDANDSDIPSTEVQTDIALSKIDATEQSIPLILPIGPKTSTLNGMKMPSGEHSSKEDLVLHGQASEAVPAMSASTITTTRNSLIRLSERIASQHIQANQHSTPTIPITPNMDGTSSTTTTSLEVGSSPLVSRAVSNDVSLPPSKPDEASGTAMLVKQRVTSETSAQSLVKMPTATPHAQSDASIEAVPKEATQTSDTQRTLTSIDRISTSYGNLPSDKSATSPHMLRTQTGINAQQVSPKLDQAQKASAPVEVTPNSFPTQSNPTTRPVLNVAEQTPISSSQKVAAATDTTQHAIIADQPKFSASYTPSEIPVETGAKPIPPLLATLSTQRNVSNLLSSSENQISSIATSIAPEIFNWDTTQSVSSLQNNSGQPRGDLAPHVARQLAEAMPQAANRPIEIALSPHELGRVRMSIVADDNAITVNIVAERGETMDLMRRHIDQLGQTFRSMGYDQINFEFEQGAQDSDHAEGGTPSEQTEPKSSSDQVTDALLGEETTIIHLNDASADGVDIRL